MKLKLKVIAREDTPENCKRRVVLNHDDCEFKEWIRDTQDCVFMMWSNSRNHRGDMIYDPVLKERVEVESPYEEILDEDGCGTDEYELKDGVIAFPVDVYEHSGRSWALSGEGGACFSCPWDTARGAFVLYVDEKRWKLITGDSPKWEFKDGKPTEELYKRAHEIARAEIEEMNLCEADAYYGYDEEALVHRESRVVETSWDGKVGEERYVVGDDWEPTMDSCWGCLTEHPAKDVDFPVGCPVVTDNRYIEGDEFEQECWAFKDDITGKYVKLDHESPDKFRLVDEPKYASLWGYRGSPETNRKSYEDDFKRALTVVDVTEEVWKEFPECHAR